MLGHDDATTTTATTGDGAAPRRRSLRLVAKCSAEAAAAAEADKCDTTKEGDDDHGPGSARKRPRLQRGASSRRLSSGNIKAATKGSSDAAAAIPSLSNPCSPVAANRGRAKNSRTSSAASEPVLSNEHTARAQDTRRKKRKPPPAKATSAAPRVSKGSAVAASSHSRALSDPTPAVSAQVRNLDSLVRSKNDPDEGNEPREPYIPPYPPFDPYGDICFPEVLCYSKSDLKEITEQELLDQITYSERYRDDESEYRHVILPKKLYSFIPETYRYRLLSEMEWRLLGLKMSIGWTHYMLHNPEPHILLFKREKDFEIKEKERRLENQRSFEQEWREFWTEQSIVPPQPIKPTEPFTDWPPMGFGCGVQRLTDMLDHLTGIRTKDIVVPARPGQMWRTYNPLEGEKERDAKYWMGIATCEAERDDYNKHDVKPIKTRFLPIQSIWDEWVVGIDRFPPMRWYEYHNWLALGLEEPVSQSKDYYIKRAIVEEVALRTCRTDSPLERVIRSVQRDLDVMPPGGDPPRFLFSKFVFGKHDLKDWRTYQTRSLDDWEDL